MWSRGCSLLLAPTSYRPLISLQPLNPNNKELAVLDAGLGVLHQTVPSPKVSGATGTSTGVPGGPDTGPTGTCTPEATTTAAAENLSRILNPVL